jgi:cytidyltransferase-like protein
VVLRARRNRVDMRSRTAHDRRYRRFSACSTFGRRRNFAARLSRDSALGRPREEIAWIRPDARDHSSTNSKHVWITHYAKKNPDIGLVVLGSFLYTAGSAFQYVTPAYLGEISAKLAINETQMGSITAAENVGVALASILSVLLLRKVNRRTLAIAGAALCALLNLCAFFVRHFELLVSIRFLTGILGEGILFALAFVVLGSTRDRSALAPLRGVAPHSPPPKPYRIALVSTMGHLHAGHLQLVAAARQHADAVIVSIFVNPLQFGPSEDFTFYPRSLAQDCRLLADFGHCDLLFAPPVHEIYLPIKPLW